MEKFCIPTETKSLGYLRGCFLPRHCSTEGGVAKSNRENPFPLSFLHPITISHFLLDFVYCRDPLLPMQVQIQKTIHGS
jgi:hypothetical protein